MKIPYNELTPDQKRQVDDHVLSQQKAQAVVNNAKEVVGPISTAKKPFNQLSPEQQQQVRDYQATKGITNNKPKGVDLQSNNPLIPIGQAMTELGQTGELAAKDFLASVGITDKKDVANRRKEIYSERMQYAGTPVGQSKTAQVIGAATQAGVSVLPTLGVGTGIKATAVTGGLLGAMQDPGNVEDPLKERAMQAGIGAVGAVATQGALKGAGKFIAPASDAIARGAATIGQATKSKTVQAVENVLSKIPVVGTRKAMERQVATTQKAIQDFAESAQALPNESLGATIATSMAKVHAEVSNKSDLAYAKLIPAITNTKAGAAVFLPKTKLKVAPIAVELSAKLRTAPSSASEAAKAAISSDPVQIANNEMLSIIEKITATPKTDFATAFELSKSAGELYRSTKKLSKPLAESFLPIVQSLEDDITNVAQRAGLGNAWDKTNKNYANVIVPMRAFVTKGINAGKQNIRAGEDVAGIDTSTLYNLFSKADVDVLPQAKAMVSSLDGAGKNALKNVIVGDIYNASINKKGEVDFFKFNTNLKNTMKGLGLVADSNTMQVAKGLLKITENIKSNPIVNANVSQAAQIAGTLTQRATGVGAAVGLYANPGLIAPVAAGAVAVKALSSALTSKSGIKAIQYIARLNDKNPKTAEIISAFLGRLMATSAGPSNPEEVNPQ